jgi:hypothetical protein
VISFALQALAQMVNHHAFIVIALSSCGSNAIKDLVWRPCTRGASSKSCDVFHRKGRAKRQRRKK